MPPPPDRTGLADETACGRGPRSEGIDDAREPRARWLPDRSGTISDASGRSSPLRGLPPRMPSQADGSYGVSDASSSLSACSRSFGAGMPGSAAESPILATPTGHVRNPARREPDRSSGWPDPARAARGSDEISKFLLGHGIAATELIGVLRPDETSGVEREASRRGPSTYRRPIAERTDRAFVRPPSAHGGGGPSRRSGPAS